MANDCDIKSLMTLSSKSEGSTGPQLRKWRNAPLHERCTIHDMVKLKEAFQNAYRSKLLPNEFRQLLKTLLNVEYDDDEFKILFMKINTNRTGEIDWDELVSHLLLGYFGNDPENQRDSLQPPIMGLPTVIRSHHRHPISRICFCPDVAKDRSTDPTQGNYITASRDGVINWWSLDMTLLRSAQSSSPHLKVRTTWVTDMVCMPDVNIIVTSSTERDLRFYDCTAKTFTLKIVITSWEYMICTMHYHFHKDVNEKCMLICGDVGGNVRVLLFSAVERGPFRNQAGRALLQLRHVDLIKKPQLLPEMKLVQLEHVHSDWVRQVSYYASLHCVVSCATCADSLLMCDIQGSKTYNMFRVEKGIQCFAFDEEAHVLLTGGPDCVVRVWNPFVTARASAELVGHHAAVTALVLQPGPERLAAYSLARDRVIKVWDVHTHTCLQTYSDVPAAVGERWPLCAAYHAGARTLVLGGMRVATLLLDEQAEARHSDGATHARALAALLYNPLFKVVLSCGMDSIIINWDPLTGKRNAMVREAHTRQLHGELIPVEITAACFDPGYQLLLTGARDGSLKVWNFNTGVCLRMLSIEYMCEVTNCFWVEGRILAVGWNRRVTEFSEGGAEGGGGGGGGGGAGKGWEARHTDDVLAAAARPPAVLATATYNSELILWKLETGQPYRQFLCSDPTRRIKMQYNKREVRSPQPTTRRRSTARSISVSGTRAPLSVAAAAAKARARRAASAARPADHTLRPRPPAVHAMVFLHTRPSTSRDASLFLSLESGQVQGWSEHAAGGLQGAFCGVHARGDYVAALAADPADCYLFTGTTLGYIKVWLLTNYLTTVKQHVSMPQLRLEFPFLWKDRVEGRAKRRVRDQPLPLLLNSYRAHLRCVTCCTYIPDLKLLLSGSSDYSVRVWRLSGQYVRTLGGVGAAPAGPEPRLPPDVLKVASSTTLKVWRGGQVSRYVPGQAAVDTLRDITELELRTRTFGAPAPAPLLGRHLRLPPRPERQPPPALDASLPTIPLYSHLRMSWWPPVRRPPTPPLVRDTRLRAASARRTHFQPAPAPP